MTTYEDIVKAANNLSQVRTKYLCERGWVERSTLPDYIWRWQKDLPDVGSVWVDADAAISIQRELDYDLEEEKKKEGPNDDERHR